MLEKRYKANAKINLFLQVTGKREDGYHLLESLAVFAEDLYDEITIKEADKYKLEITGSFAKLLDCNEEDNLVTKAIYLLAEKYKFKPNYHIRLEKNIPVGAGIGGGSSDAACIIRAFIEMFEIKPDIEDIKQISLKLGADVFPCYYNKALAFKSIGEDVSLLPFAPVHAVIVNNYKPLLTKDVFKKRQGGFTKILDEESYLYNNINEQINFISVQRNDLEEAALSLDPEIEMMINLLKRQKDCWLARMSGSGASCFGIFPSRKAAIQALKNVRVAQNNWFVKYSLLY